MSFLGDYMFAPKLHVLYISPNIYANDGIARYVISSIKYMREDIKVSVFFQGKKIDHDGEISFSGNVMDVKKDINSIIQSNAQIIHIHYAIPTYGLMAIYIWLLVYIVRKKTGVKVVISFHEVKREFDMLGILCRWYYQIVTNLCDEVIVHTTNAKQILLKNNILTRDKIEVIPLGIPKQISRVLGTKQNKKYILFFGYIHIDKGIEYLLQAVKYIKDQRPALLEKYSVLIAGDVRPRKGIFCFFELLDNLYKKRLWHLTSELGLKKNVTFCGHIRDEEIDNIMNLSAVGVLPYKNAEQSGVLHEFLSYNIPVIATQVGGLSEVLEESGSIVQPKNHIALAQKIIDLLTNSKKESNTQYIYKKIIEKNSFEMVREKTIDVYEKIR